MYSITEGDFVIRSMKVSDVSAYVSQFAYDTQQRKMQIKEIKQVIKEKADDDPRLYFVILKRGRVIGGITALPMENNICNYKIFVEVPNCYEVENIKVIEDLFVKFAREEYFFDDICFYKPVWGFGWVPSGKTIPIAVSSRWKQSAS